MNDGEIIGIQAFNIMHSKTQSYVLWRYLFITRMDYTAVLAKDKEP